VSALEAASALTAAKTLTPEEMEALRAGDSLDLKRLLNELGEDGPDAAEEETPEGPVHQDLRYTSNGASAQT
jgi:hypothetical protein